MDMNKNGKMLRKLRTERGLTQKQVAKMLGVVPKTISKWETGNGFPDVSVVSEIADIYGVSERTLLSGTLDQRGEQVGNVKKIKFYVCPHCGGFMQSLGDGEVFCCGKKLASLDAKEADAEHTVTADDDGREINITFNHEMTKEHYLSFAAYVSYDRVLTVRLYPEQDSAVRFAKTHGGVLYYYCTEHGLFVHQFEVKKTKRSKGASLTSLMSAFARAYHAENAENCVFKDEYAGRLFSADEYSAITGYIANSGKEVNNYVNTNLAPTVLARAAYCEDSLKTAVMTGTEQYVILGSGLDTYCLRADGDVRVFEIDTGKTVADKLSRMERAGLKAENTVFIDGDVSCGIENLLVKNGFDRRKKTLFSCLGLLYYITKDEIANLFKEISSFAAAGSSVVFDFGDSHMFSSGVERVKNMVEMAKQSGEEMKSCFGYGELEKMLEDCGFLIYEFLNEAQIQSRFFENSTLSAFEHINFATAVKNLER